MRRLCADAEALCRAAAPDAAHRPFYVILRSNLPPEYQGSDGGALAATSRHMDPILRPTLALQRRLCGRGPAILLDSEAIIADIATRRRSAHRLVFASLALSVVLHEPAHIIHAGPREDAEVEPSLIEFGRLLLAADLRGTEQPANGPSEIVHC
jgi:hypothetical protein